MTTNIICHILITGTIYHYESYHKRHPAEISPVHQKIPTSRLVTSKLL